MQTPTDPERQPPSSPAAAAAIPPVQPSSPSLFLSSMAAAAPSPGSHRRIAIAVDLSDESAYAVKWAVQNYLRPGDAVILLHVRPTSVLYGADWGSIELPPTAADAGDSEEINRMREDEFDAFTTTKAQDVSQPLVDAQIPFKIHIVKDHDMKERLCLEVERLGLSAVIMGSRGVGATRRSVKGRLGSVSDYCVHHCICPVVVVRREDKDGGHGSVTTSHGFEAVTESTKGSENELQPVLEEDQEDSEGSDDPKDA